jgi:hypothetical protein
MHPSPFERRLSNTSYYFCKQSFHIKCKAVLIVSSVIRLTVVYFWLILVHFPTKFRVTILDFLCSQNCMQLPNLSFTENILFYPILTVYKGKMIFPFFDQIWHIFTWFNIDWETLFFSARWRKNLINHILKLSQMTDQFLVQSARVFRLVICYLQYFS